MNIPRLESGLAIEERFNVLARLYAEMGLSVDDVTQAKICGGSVVRILLGKRDEFADVDVLFTDEKKYLHTVGALVVKGWHPRGADHSSIGDSTVHTEVHYRCVLTSRGGQILDLVYSSRYGSMTWAQILYEFDLNLSQIAYTPGILSWVRDNNGSRLDDLEQKKLYVVHHKKNTPERLEKYQRLLNLPVKSANVDDWFPF